MELMEVGKRVKAEDVKLGDKLKYDGKCVTVIGVKRYEHTFNAPYVHIIMENDRAYQRLYSLHDTLQRWS
jgi:riboflavin synthase alpha subunit